MKNSSKTSPPDKNQLSPAAALICGVLALMLAAVMLNLSARAGRLAVPLGYDDVSYVLSGFKVHQALIAGDKLAVLSELSRSIAPMHAGIAALAQGLFGFREWAVYAMNVPLLLALIGGVLWMARPLGLLPQIAIALVILSMPLAGNLVTEFRPDFMWGFLCGFAAYLIFDRRFLRGSAAYQVAVAVVSALALSAKPSALPATLVFLGYAAGASFLLLLKEEIDAGRSTRKYWERFGFLLGAVAVLGAPYYLQNASRLFKYIYSVFTVQNIYASKDDIWYQFTYYSVGQAYYLTLHLVLWLGLAVFVINVFICVHQDRQALWRYIVYSTIVLVAYIVPTMSPIKSYYLGGIFYGSFVIFTVHGLVRIFVTLGGYSSTATRIAASALVVLAFFEFQPSSMLITESQRKAKEIRAVNEQVIDGLAREVAARQWNRAPLVFVPGPTPITSDYLQLKMGWAGLPVRGKSGYYLRTLQEQLDRLQRADFVVLTEAQNAFPGQILSPELIARVRSDPAFFQIVDFTNSRGEHTYLFAQRSKDLEISRGTLDFQDAIAANDEAALRQLIDTTPVLDSIADAANARFSVGEESKLTLVAAFAAMGWRDGIEILIKRGVELKLPANADGLCVAANLGHDSVALLFLENGVTPAALPACPDRRSPAEVAYEAGSKALMKKLVAAGWRLGT